MGYGTFIGPTEGPPSHRKGLDMPTLTVNTQQTFSTMLLLSASVKTKFGTNEPDVTKAGEPKYSVEVAASYLAEEGQRVTSEVISITLIGGDLPVIAPGTPVEFGSLRAGVSAPEKRDNGRISGGKLYWMASGIRQASSYRSTSKSDAA